MHFARIMLLSLPLRRSHQRPCETVAFVVVRAQPPAARQNHRPSVPASDGPGVSCYA